MKEIEKDDLLMTKIEKTPEEALAVCIALASNTEANKIAEDLLAQGKLLTSRKAFVDEKRGVLAEELLSAAYALGKTFTEAAELLNKSAEKLPEEERKNFYAEFAEAMNIFRALNEDIGFLKNRSDLLYARTPAEALGISSKTLEWIYDIGKAYLEQNQAKNAQTIFTVLVYLNPFSSSAWIGLGFAQRNLQNLSEAASSFFMASILDPESIPVLCNLAQTYFDLEIYEQAKTCLYTLEELAQKQGVTELDPIIKEFRQQLSRRGV